MHGGAPSLPGPAGGIWLLSDEECGGSSVGTADESDESPSDWCTREDSRCWRGFPRAVSAAVAGALAVSAMAMPAFVALRLRGGTPWSPRGTQSDYGSLSPRSLSKAKCNTDTGGRCGWTGVCDISRGPTTCNSVAWCVCQEGYCTDETGNCRLVAAPVADPTMVDVSVAKAFDLESEEPGVVCQNTLGWTDGWSGCAYQDGGHDPVLCKPTPGAKWPSTSGWTCQAYRDKGWCKNGSAVNIPWWAWGNRPTHHCCACGGGTIVAEQADLRSPPVPKPGFCQRFTGGTCNISPCHTYRGATECVNDKCMCKEGYCSDSAGTCHRQSPTIKPMVGTEVSEGLRLRRTAPGTVCQDTPDWNNLWSHCAYEEDGHDPELCMPTPRATWPSTRGWTCGAYERKGWCGLGVTQGSNLGPWHNYPERHCCSCGGGRRVVNETAAALVLQARTRCSRDTGHACLPDGECWSGLGDTTCIRLPGDTNTLGVCSCKTGHCADSNGKCHRDIGLVSAGVVPVNIERPYFPGSHGKIATALCISGGGSRSLAAAAGQLRALHHLGLLEHIDALSVVSGGAWAGSIYMFADMNLDQLLGPLTVLAELSLEVLDKDPAPLTAAATAGTSSVAMHLLAGGEASSRLWISVVAHAILKPFGLANLSSYMAPDSETVDRIRRSNPQLNDAKFLVPQQGRPKTFVMGGVIEAPDGYKASDDCAVSLQMSPDFTGSPFYPDNSTVDYWPAFGTMKSVLRNVLVGGGLTETFAFGSDEPTERQSGGAAVWLEAPAVPFSLARAVGISSAGLAALLSQAGLLDVNLGSTLSPQASVWPVTSTQFPMPQQALTYQLGDGGNIDNTGLLAMIQRRAQRIALMLNTGDEFIQDDDYCNVTEDYNPSGKVAGDLSDKFGYPGPQISGAMFYGKNQVFAKKELVPLLCEFQGLLEEGKPLVARRELEVQPNSWWGITGGFIVEVVFVLLEKSAAFEEQLPNETRQELNKGDLGKFRGFPRYSTTFQNTDFTALSAPQASLLAAQSEYSVVENGGLFKVLFR